nr:Hpt domain-containing protein [Gemmatimonadaceae bacterium]
PPDLDRLDDAARAQDREAVRQIAHTLKGAASVAGLREVSTALAAVQRNARSTEWLVLARDVAAVRRAFDMVIPVVRERLAHVARNDLAAARA